LRDKIIENAPEMFEAIIDFVAQIESGRFTARSTYNNLKIILDRIPRHLLLDERLTA
jgi:hypothetical protein